MNRFTLLAFNARIQAPTGASTVTAYTAGGPTAAKLGLFDQLGFVLAAEEVSGTNPNLSCTLQHSGDGVHWMDKPGTLNIPTFGLDPSATTTLVGFDDGIIPSLRFVRFALTMSGTGPMNVSVTLDVTANDVREGKFARKMRRTLLEQGDANECGYTIQGGTYIGQGSGDFFVIAAAAAGSGLADGKGPLVGYLTPEGDGYRLAPDARICVEFDGRLILSNAGGSIELRKATDRGNAGTGATC